ncbi:MAG: hypothetical protein IT178_01950, partial [Acidobacteria bacterium]|nr:hypothetical protein [Acidobacteriota bacterium]
MLDLRHRQEEKATRLLAQAQASLSAAQAREQQAREQTARAVADIEAAQTIGVEAWRLEWHRNWIVRQRRDADACARATAISAVSVAHATTTLNMAR